MYDYYYNLNKYCKILFLQGLFAVLFIFYTLQILVKIRETVPWSMEYKQLIDYPARGSEALPA